MRAFRFYQHFAGTRRSNVWVCDARILLSSVHVKSKGNYSFYVVQGYFIRDRATFGRFNRTVSFSFFGPY